MPWCEPCGRFYNPNTLSPEGKCPADHQVGDPAKAGQKVPWHFWMLLGALVLYLGWRVFQGVLWIV